MEADAACECLPEVTRLSEALETSEGGVTEVVQILRQVCWGEHEG
jgi:hypothetical protein